MNDAVRTGSHLWMRGAAALLALLLCACTTSPITLQQAQPPQPGRADRELLIQPDNHAQRSGTATLAVVRDVGVSMGACAHDIFLNDRFLVSLFPGEGARFAVPAGRVRLRLQTGGIICSPFSTNAETDATVGETFTVRSGVAGQLAFLLVVK